MGLDHPSGPCKGPEVGDEPATPGSGDTPPPRATGSSSETPRADSLRAAGWKLDGHEETGTQQRGDRDQRTGETSSAVPAGDQQSGPGETGPAGKKEPETGKPGTETGSHAGERDSEDGRPTTGTSETAGTGERDQDPRATDTRQLPPQTDTGTADTFTSRDNGEQPKDPAGRTEPTADRPKPTADKAEPLQQTDTPPATGPAPTGPPMTRAESLRAAGWQSPELPDHRAPQTGTADTAPQTEQSREQDGQGLPRQDTQPPQSDSRPPEQLPAGEQTLPDETTDQGRPPQPARADTTDPQAADGPPGNSPQPDHEPTGEKTDQPSGPQDGLPEGATDETQAGERGTERLGDSAQTPPIPDGQSSADGQTSQPESTEQPPAEQDEPHTTDNTPGPQETADDEPKPPEPQGEQDVEHGRNAENDGTDQNSNENTLPYLGPYNPDGQFTQALEEAREGNFDATRSSDYQETTTENPRWITEPLEVQQSSTQRDFDPTGAEREPGVAAKAPDRRTDRETELEPGIDKFRRATWARGRDLKNVGTLADDATEGLLGPRPPAPSGHAEVGTGPAYSQSGTSGATPDSFVAALSAVMVAAEAARGAKQLTSRVIGLIRR